MARCAAEFLDWLDEPHSRSTAATKLDVDRLVRGRALHPSASATAFLTWAIQHRHCDRRSARAELQPGRAKPDAHRAAHRGLVARLINDTSLDSTTASLACSSPSTPSRVSRIIRLRLDDLRHHRPQDRRPRRRRRTHRARRSARSDDPRTRRRQDRHHDDGCFPARHPGQPLNPKTLGQRLVRLGVNRAARVAALHDLIRRSPDPSLLPSSATTRTSSPTEPPPSPSPGPTIRVSAHAPGLSDRCCNKVGGVSAPMGIRPDEAAFEG